MTSPPVSQRIDFLGKIIDHYLRESHQGLGAALFGGILLIAALLLFRFASPMSFFRGLTIPFLVIGLVMGLGGSIDGATARRAIPERTTLFKKDRKAFFDQETVRVQKTHRSWRRIFLFWSVLTITGIALLLGARKSYWTGVAIGAIAVSLAGHIEESISRNFNENYYHQVLGESGKAGLPDHR
jgi:hypothetical protein